MIRWCHTKSDPCHVFPSVVTALSLVASFLKSHSGSSLSSSEAAIVQADHFNPGVDVK